MTHCETQTQTDILSDIQNLLDRIHVPVCYAHQIESYYKKNFTTKSKNSIIFSIYKVLNDFQIPISLKEISNVSNVTLKKLNKAHIEDSFVKRDTNVILDKHCALLGLCYKTTTLIKNRLVTAPISGHNPNSVLASLIYQVCRELKKKISIKKISEVTSVSCISIQRYNNFSKKLKC
jgi:transcription initiation factor TFIIIB Brf1 subunit/transcription initiation factor TFIIB